MTINYKRYVGILILISSILLFGPIITGHSDLTKKTKKIYSTNKKDNDKIISDDGETFIFSETINRPNYTGEYIVYLENDTVYRWRKPLGMVGEIIYFFRFNDVNPTQYTEGKNKVQIDEDHNPFLDIFWLTVVVAVLIFSFRVGAYYSIEYNLNREAYSRYIKYNWYFFALEMFTMIFIAFHLMTITHMFPMFIAGIIPYIVSTILYCCYFVDDMIIFVNKRTTILNKEQDYNDAYNQLLNNSKH